MGKCLGQHGRAELMGPRHRQPAFILGHGKHRAVGVQAFSLHLRFVSPGRRAQEIVDHPVEAVGRGRLDESKAEHRLSHEALFSHMNSTQQTQTLGRPG
jgi:hypothetical protein